MTKVLISADGVNWFSASEDFTFFKSPSFSGVDNRLLPLIGKEYIKVLGSDFYNTGSSTG